LIAKKNDGEYHFNSTFKRKPVSNKMAVNAPLKAVGALKQLTPIKTKREKPRRSLPERTQHERIALKAGEKPNALEKQHTDRVSKMHCLVCGAKSTLHHVTGYADKMGRITRSHKCVVPLAPSIIKRFSILLIPIH
jgi:hypothetical protein